MRSLQGGGRCLVPANGVGLMSMSGFRGGVMCSALV